MSQISNNLHYYAINQTCKNSSSTIQPCSGRFEVKYCCATVIIDSLFVIITNLYIQNNWLQDSEIMSSMGFVYQFGLVRDLRILFSSFDPPITLLK
ncbi:unnamed protein product [Paramecium octaurelia]|uniref:Uncharacterized protein n=1 Tax=Paramecium octaurelia TaxID=43137 RepID=A0A8S1UYH3_PAROT|nr:unnamed protein product [Paramecium octaurelia]